MELAGKYSCKQRFRLLPNAGLRAGCGRRSVALDLCSPHSPLCLTTGLFRNYDRIC